MSGSSFKKFVKSKISLTIFSLLIYALLFPLLVRIMGERASILTLFPTLTIALFYGTLPGLIAAILIIPLNLFYLSIFGFYPVVLLDKNFPLMIGSMIIALIAGRLSELNKNYKTHIKLLENEVSERKKAEEKVIQLQNILQSNHEYYINNDHQDEEISYYSQITIDWAENKYRDIAENAFDIIYTTDINGTFTYANKAAIKTSGYNLDEFSKLNFTDIVSPELRKKIKIFYQRQYLNKQINTYLEFPIKLKDGTTKWYGHNATLIIKENKITGFSIIAQDISEKINAQKALIKSEERYRNLFGNSPIGIYRTTPDGKILLANPALLKMLKYKDFEELALQNLETKAAEFNRYSRKKFKSNIESNGEIIGLESVWLTKDGDEIFIRENAKCIYDKSGQAKYYEGTVEDITEQVKAAESIKESEEKFRTLAERSPGIIFIHQGGKFVFVNEKCIEILGYPKEYFISEKFDIKQIIDKGCINKVEKFYSYAVKGGELTNEEFTLVNSSGEKIEILLSTSNINYGRKKAILGILTDITDRMKARNALKESEEKLRMLAHTAKDAIVTTDRNFNIVLWNETAEKIYGYKSNEVLGKSFGIIIPEPDRTFFFKNVVTAEDPLSIVEGPVFERIGLKKDGELFPIEVSVAQWKINDQFYYTHIVRDITKRKEIEKKLKQSENDYRQLFLTAHEPIMIFEPEDEIILEVNDIACKIYGYERDEFIGRSLKELTSNVTKGEKKIRQILETGDIVNFETIHSRKDGKKLHFEMNASLFQYKGQKVILSMNRDVTHKKEAESRLKLLASAVNSTSEAITITDLDNKLVFVNKSFTDIYGYTSAEVMGKSPEMLLSDKNSPDIMNTIFNRTTTGKWSGTLIDKKKNGEEFYVSLNTSNIVDEKNNLIGLIGVAQDITKEIEANNKLIESEQRYRTLFDHSVTSKFIIDPSDGSLHDVNEAAVKFYGYSKEEMLKMYLWQIGTNPKEKTLKNLKEATASSRINYRFKHKLKNGEIRDVEVFAGQIKLGGKAYILSMNTDITEKLKIERELSEYRMQLEKLVQERTESLSKVNTILNKELKKIKIADAQIKNQVEFFQTLINTIPLPVFIRNNKDKSFEDCNESFEEFFGVKKQQIIGKETSKILSGELIILQKILGEESLDKNKYYSFETILLDYKQKSHNVIIYLASFKQNSDSLEGTVGIILDITHQKTLQEEISRTLEKEKELGELRSRFVSTASHEFRTPLTTILTSADLLELYGRKWPDSKYYEYVANIQNAVEYMTEMINDVLIVSKSDSRKITFNPSKIDLLKLTKNIFNNIEMSASQSVHMNYEYNLKEKYFMLDNKLLTQIITNLLSNAVKYSPDGGKVNFIVSFKENCLVFEISDQGIGIPKDDQAHLFEPFFRAQNVGAIKGTGLGLSIVKKSVELHEGRLILDSDTNKGTKFRIFLNCVENSNLVL